MALWILRGIYLVTAAALGASLAIRLAPDNPWAVFFLVMCVASLAIALDVVWRRKRLDIISSVYFGVIVGVFMSYFAGLALVPVLPDDKNTREAVNLVLTLSLVYLCTSLLLQTRHDFRFVIPYVEFSREVRGVRPVLLDTSAVIDGRIADVVDTGLLDQPLVVPQFVLSELQGIADSSDRTKRSRGRRGLDILQRLRGHEDVDLQVLDREEPNMHGQPVDLKLVLLAKHLDAKILTIDYNLNKLAQLEGVPVLNLNDLAGALKPPYLPGEELTVRIVKPGEESSQGVGYLEDGTMVVIEGARHCLNKRVHALVTSTLQTSAGRMIFGRFDREHSTP